MSLKVNSFICYRKCPCGTECNERQFLSRVNFLFITFINLSLSLHTSAFAFNPFFQVSTSTWPSGQYWRDLGLEFFDPDDFQVSHIHIQQTNKKVFFLVQISTYFLFREDRTRSNRQYRKILQG